MICGYICETIAVLKSIVIDAWPDETTTRRSGPTVKQAFQGLIVFVFSVVFACSMVL